MRHRISGGCNGRVGAIASNEFPFLPSSFIFMPNVRSNFPSVMTNTHTCPQEQPLKRNKLRLVRRRMITGISETMDDEVNRTNYYTCLNEFLCRMDEVSRGRWGCKPEICIFSVPEKLRKLKEDAYNPHFVSIGPFHLNKGNLAPMQQHKMVYQYSLFSLLEVGETYEKYQEREADRRRCEMELRVWKMICGCYSGLRCELNPCEIQEILFLDGCFILELFLRFAPDLNYITPEKYESDPLINSAWMVRALCHDLALLENQIPFFTLEVIYDMIKPRLMSKCKAPESVTSLALSFFKPMMSQNTYIEKHYYMDCMHLLDLLHKSSLLATSGVGTAFERRVILKHAPGNLTPGDQYYSGSLNYCASELVQSGIELCKESGDSLANITFMRNGGLIKIPPVLIYDIRDSLFRNLIAYEQNNINTRHHVTSYAILMKTLIRSPRDVKLLRRKGIISQNWIEDEEYVTQFRSLLQEVIPKDFYFGDLCEEVNAYASKFWFRRKMHSLYLTYFSTAWSMISFIAAICLFILTFLQTYFTINPR